MDAPLNNAQVRKLKSLAQRMDAILKVGRNGLSDGFIRTVDDSLTLHELIKVKFDDLKDQKKELAPQMAERTKSHLVTLIGNVAVLYREQPDPAKRVVKFEA